jgi:hypothetical protein
MRTGDPVIDMILSSLIVADEAQAKIDAKASAAFTEATKGRRQKPN